MRPGHALHACPTCKLFPRLRAALPCLARWPSSALTAPPACHLPAAAPAAVCAAVCAAFPGAPALGEAQRAMAAWLAGSGARSPGEVVSVLDSSQQVWGMALAATDGAGAKLVHWVALLNGCKQAAGM